MTFPFKNYRFDISMQHYYHVNAAEWIDSHIVNKKMVYILFILMVLCLKKIKYSHWPIRMKAKGRVSASMYFSQLIITCGRCVFSCCVEVLTEITSVFIGLISTTLAWYGSSLHAGALSLMSRMVMFTWTKSTKMERTGQKGATHNAVTHF